MANKDVSKKSGYVVDVKVVDVEKRYYEGPKHYVCSKEYMGRRTLMNI